MIETYQKDGLILEVVKLEDTISSILECADFVVGLRHDYRMTDTNSGIIIKFPEWTLNAKYGNYIVKNAKNEFNVVSDDAFETMYVPILEPKKEET